MFPSHAETKMNEIRISKANTWDAHVHNVKVHFGKRVSEMYDGFLHRIFSDGFPILFEEIWSESGHSGGVREDLVNHVNLLLVKHFIEKAPQNEFLLNVLCCFRISRSLSPMADSLDFLFRFIGFGLWIELSSREREADGDSSWPRQHKANRTVHTTEKSIRK